MNKSRLTHRPLLVMLAVLIWATAAMAQSNKGAIVGTVRDPNDALVTQAKIKVTSVKTAEVREAESSDDGTYTVTNLEPGAYNVTAEAAGFQTVNIEAVVVETNARLPLDVKFTTVAGGAGSDHLC